MAITILILKTVDNEDCLSKSEYIHLLFSLNVYPLDRKMRLCALQGTPSDMIACKLYALVTLKQITFFFFSLGIYIYI